MAKVDLKENIIDLDKVDELTKTEKAYCKEVESLFQVKRWLSRPVAALDPEGKILLLRSPQVPKKPEEYTKYEDIKKAERELIHRTTGVVGKSFYWTRIKKIYDLGELPKLNNITKLLSETSSNLIGDIPERIKDKNLQNVKHLINEMRNVRNESKIAAISHIDKALSTKDRNEQLESVVLANVELGVRQLKIQRDVLHASRALKTIVRMETKADNLLQFWWLKVREYKIDVIQKGNISEKHLSEYLKSQNAGGKLQELLNLDYLPYKKRVESTPIRKLAKLPKVLSEVTRKERSEVLSDILTTLDSGLKESLGKNGYYSFLKKKEPLKQPTL